MTDFAVVIPTDGASGSLLSHLVRHADEDEAHVIVIWTADPDDMPDWMFELPIRVVIFNRTRNIQTWWNEGLDYARNRLDLDVAVFCNDDIEVEDGDLAKMADLCGHTLSMVAGHYQSGWCFGLDLHANLRFDESYQWWYGETDMMERAQALNGIYWVEGTHVCHKKFRNTEYVELRDVIQRDIDLWSSRH